MVQYIIEFTDEEDVAWQAYLAFHQAQPAGSFLRILPVGEVASVDEIIAGIMAPARQMIDQWYALQPPT